jgi:hypothetical protein
MQRHRRNAGERLPRHQASGEAGLAGGAIHDAILGHCVLKAKAKVLYTWNTKDFLRLVPAIAERVKTPERA